MKQLIALATLVAATMGGVELATKKAITLEIAKQMAAAAEAEASKNKWNVVVAILDDGGNLVYLQRMDDTQIASIEVAQMKARTAIGWKRPSKAFEEMLANRIAVLGFPVMPAPGGLPITVDGKIIGAIGVSDVTSAQDEQIAQAGVDSLPKILGR